MRPTLCLVVAWLAAGQALQAQERYSYRPPDDGLGAMPSSVSAFGAGGLNSIKFVPAQQPVGMMAAPPAAPAVVPTLPAVPPPVVVAPGTAVPPTFIGVPAPAVGAVPLYGAVGGCGGCASCQQKGRWFTGRLFGGGCGAEGCSACGGHHLLSRPGAACSPGCQSCAVGGCQGGKCKGGHGGDLLGRIKAWFCYHDHGDCALGCVSCKSSCGAPLYLYFLKDCAERTGCQGCGDNGVTAVNPPYSRSIFPTGHMFMGMPTANGGVCCGGGYKH